MTQQRTKGNKQVIVEEPNPYTCAACIDAAANTLSNVDRIMFGPGGYPVGLKLKSPAEARSWMESINLCKCPCLPPNSKNSRQILR